MYLFCYKYNELRSWADIGKQKIILWVPCHFTHQNIKLLGTLNNLLGFDIFALMNYKLKMSTFLNFGQTFFLWAFSRWWKAYGTLLVGLLEVADSLIVSTLRKNCRYFPKETAPSIRKCSGTDWNVAVIDSPISASTGTSSYCFGRTKLPPDSSTPLDT